MTIVEYLNNYFVEVHGWGKQVLALLYNREEENEEKNELMLKVESLLNRIENENIQDEYFAKVVENDVEEIEQKLSELLATEVLVSKELRVEIGKHILPPLPYPYNSLEPYISRETMMLHHNEHHQNYVEGLNRAEQKLRDARMGGDYHLIKHWEREAAFNGSGHYLHTIFWNNLSRNGGGEPIGRLQQQINQDFGSFHQFKEHFSEAAKHIEGVGWVILVWSPRAHHLEILQTEKHHLYTQWDTIPLLVLDMWEHAYYLQYKTKKKEYIQNFFRIINWRDVSERFDKASELKWKTF